MTMVFRHADPRFPFLWEDGALQPPSRWKAPGTPEPVHCFADTADGAWAELLRHEEITDPTDLAGIERDLWAVELPGIPAEVPALAHAILTGDEATYPACQGEARRLLGVGTTELTAPSGALIPGGARGSIVNGGLQPGPDRDGRVFVLMGQRPDLVGWCAARRGRPGRELLARINHL